MAKTQFISDTAPTDDWNSVCETCPYKELQYRGETAYCFPRQNGGVGCMAVKEWLERRTVTKLSDRFVEQFKF